MLSLWPQEAPCLVIGHRGAMAYAPENTIAAFEEGIRRGADLLELDVQLSADGEVIVIHDTSVDRTTNGSGLVRDMTWKKLKTLDAGVWYGPDYADQFIPSLTEVLRHFRMRRTSHQRGVGFIIELKTVRGSAGALADAVVSLLHREQFIERTAVISFDAVALQEVRSAHRTIPTGLLYSEEGEESRIAQARAIGAQILCPRKTCVTARGVVAAHKAGLAVSTWTANTKNEMKRLMTCGVDSITTNFPDRLRSTMQ